jgi:hypothetical protein
MGSRVPDGPKQSARKGRKPAPFQLGCKVELGRGRARVLRSGTAALAPDALRFHTGRTGREGPDFSLHLDFDAIERVEVDGPAGTMTVTTAEHGPVVFHLGRAAEEWSERVQARPGPLAELGIGARTRVALVGVGPEALAGLEAELAGRAAEGEVDVLLVGVEHPADLRRLGEVARRVRAGGVVWAVSPRTGARVPDEAAIGVAATAVGLAPGHAVLLGRGHRALRLVRSGR